jgi:hypothetical protein
MNALPTTEVTGFAIRDDIGFFFLILGEILSAPRGLL